MVINYPRSIASHIASHVASHDELPSAGATHAEGFGSRVFDWVRQTICGIHGHDSLLQFEQERMCLRCFSCGHTTPGWALNETPPTITLRGDPRRHALARPQLITARRIA